MHKTLIVMVVFVVLTGFGVSSVFCQEWFDSGLEVAEPKVYVSVRELTDDAIDIGLSESLIRSKVELALRKNGITPGTEADSFLHGYWLDISVHVVGAAFSARASFWRKVYYFVEEIKWVYGKTWRYGYIGTHRRGSRYIIEAVEDSVDIFSSQFLMANDFD